MRVAMPRVVVLSSSLPVFERDCSQSNYSSILNQKVNNIRFKGLPADKKTLVKKPDTRIQTVKNYGYIYLLHGYH